LLKFTDKTYYALGIVASTANIIGGAAFILGSYLSLIFSIASILGGAMMLFLTSGAKGDRKKQLMLFFSSIMLLCSMLGGIIGTVGGALAWPLFALWYFLDTKGEESNVHTMAFVTMLCGVIQLALSFFPLEQRVMGCLAIAFAAVQGVFAWVLFQREKQRQSENPE
jgi:heme O synthase-like polyprenyltransferase